MSRLDDDEKNTVVLIDGNRGNPNTTVINEPGLYALVLGSRKPEAKAFKRWITLGDLSREWCKDMIDA